MISLVVSVAVGATLFVLNRWRVRRLALHLGRSRFGIGAAWCCIHAALAGVILAVALPTRPAPAVGPLLGQAATALAGLNMRRTKPTIQRRHAASSKNRSGIGKPIYRGDRSLLSPADRIERAVAPWTAYVILPLFAFSATGVSLSVDLSSPDAWPILLGVILGLVIGKPLGIALASWVAIKARIAAAPDDVTVGNFIGAACLCGVGDTVALLMADQAFPQGMESAVAKIGVLIGSALAAVWGTRSYRRYDKARGAGHG